MKTIVIKTQAEWDDLPSKFNEQTTIEIRTDGIFWLHINKVPDSSRAELRGSSRAVLWDSSRAELRDSSRAVLRDSSSAVLCDSSRAECQDFSFAFIFSSACIIKKLLDYSTAIFRGVKKRVEEFSETSVIREVPGLIDHSFEEILSRGYVKADGITKKLISKKKVKHGLYR
jgi:hypothetical protein